MKIGFVGLGRMGAAMARRLCSTDHDLRVYDTQAMQRAQFASTSAQIASDLKEVCEERELVISMLPNDEVLTSFVLGSSGLCSYLPSGAIHMVSGTHGVTTIQRLIEAHADHNQILVSCTVLGRPERAQEGKLGLIPAGPTSEIARLLPILEQLGNRIFRPGNNPLSAAAIKIANNFVLGCAIEAMGEAMALIRRYDVDASVFQQILTEGLFDSVAYHSYGAVIAQQDWGNVGATAVIGLKDAELALEAARRVQVPLPSGDVWRNHLLSACGRGEGLLDWSVMAREQFRRSGLE